MIIAVFTQLIVLIGIPMGFRLWKRRKASNWVKLITTNLILSLISTVLSFAGPFFGVNPNIFGFGFAIVNMSILFFVYHDLIWPKRSAIWAWGSTVLFAAGAIVNFIFFQKMSINSYTFTATGFLSTALSISYFFFLMRNPPVVLIQKFPPFWLNVGILVYNAGTTILFILTHYLIHQLNDDLKIYWSFHNLLFFIGNGFICLSLWKEYRLQKSR